ncbi:MAG: response regulator [Desulfuromusa sp.]|jgi:diguanylate cyclase (GGDEF)-like protein|nr:response regulator [Desulfuromusa sp.]
MVLTEKKRILVADAEILNLATLIGTLKDDYHVVVAKDSVEVFKQLKKNRIDMVLLDTKLPGIDGFEICRQLKADKQTQEIPVIFITAQNSFTGEEKGFEVGAVDYIVKPFNAPTVTVRIKNQLKLSAAIQELKRLNQLALDANPNTSLPGNNSLLNEIQRVVTNKEDVCVVYADLDYFKSYNDTYGFARGDDVIIFTANVIKVALRVAGCADSFLGHIGGDDFVFVVPTEKCTVIAEEISRRIDLGIVEFYSAEDIERGYVVAINREGEERHHPLVSLSMGAVDLSQRKKTTALEVIDICTEMKKTAKKQQGSNVLICKRH